MTEPHLTIWHKGEAYESDRKDWAMPSARSAALRVEPVALSQAKPAAAIAVHTASNTGIELISSRSLWSAKPLQSESAPESGSTSEGWNGVRAPVAVPDSEQALADAIYAFIRENLVAAAFGFIAGMAVTVGLASLIGAFIQ